MPVLPLRIAQRLSAAKPCCRESVAAYFNSVEQHLLALRDLSRMREGAAGSESPKRIMSRCLGQDFLPSRTAKEKSGNYTRGGDSNESIVPIVKPTDRSSDSLTTVNGDSWSPVAAGRHPTIQPNVVDKLRFVAFPSLRVVCPGGCAVSLAARAYATAVNVDLPYLS